MNEERLWELVSLKLSHEATDEDLKELESLINLFPELRFKINVLVEVWQNKNPPEVTLDTEDAFNRHLQRLSNHFANPALQYENAENEIKEAEPAINSGFFRKRLLWFTSIAAAAIITVILISLFRDKKYVPFSQNVVTTKPGSKSKITLPDGTQVWLNADSKITYDKNFGSSKREVELSGEAFFDVVKDKGRPFIIHTKSIDIKVLGTAFNVRSYPDEKIAETSLIHGLIEVTLRNNPDKKIILKPNEKLVVQNSIKKAKDASEAVAENENEPLLILSKIHYFKGDSSSVETSWVKNKLAFDGESLEEVAGKIERWYGVTITIKDDRLKAGEYTGVFEDESLNEVMDALKLTGSFSYEINKKEVVITP